MKELKGRKPPRKRKTAFHTMWEEKNQKEKEVSAKPTFQTVPITEQGIIERQKTYRWQCPSCHGNYSYSDKINAMWGHPEDKVFCAVCFQYYEFMEGTRTLVEDIEIGEKIFANHDVLKRTKEENETLQENDLLLVTDFFSVDGEGRGFVTKDIRGNSVEFSKACGTYLIRVVE